MAKIIHGNKDGKNGENQSYRIPGRGAAIPRRQIVSEIKRGAHPDFHTIKIDGTEFARANPNHRRKDNVDPDQ